MDSPEILQRQVLATSVLPCLHFECSAESIPVRIYSKVVHAATGPDTLRRLSMVAEETSKDMLGEKNAATLVPEVTGVVNQTLGQAFGDFKQLSDDDVVQLIDLGDSEGGREGKHWVLDPIDGTRGFENKRQYSVCLGLIKDGEPVLGVLGCPNMPAARFTSEYAGPRDDAGEPRDGFGLLFAAVQGCGTYESDLVTPGTPGILSLRCTCSSVL